MIGVSLRALAACAFLFVVCSGLQAASDGWSGVLRSPDGVPISGAEIHVKADAFRAEAVTDARGQFQFATLPEGEYTVSVDWEEQHASAAQSLKIPVAEGAVLTLSSDGVLFLRQNSNGMKGTGGEQLSSQKVSELPLNKRDFSQLLLLAAGTMTDTNGATNFTAQFAINGQRGVEAVFAMDGADISDPELGGATFSNFNVDAVEEIQSNSGWMPADVGRGGAGFTNIITRSGASGFHGSLFEFVRNSAFDAAIFLTDSLLRNPSAFRRFAATSSASPTAARYGSTGLSTSFSIKVSGRC